MKAFYDYLKGFVKEDFHLGYYLSVGLFLGITFAINYGGGFKEWLNNFVFFHRGIVGVAVFFAFFSFAYFTALGLYTYFYQDKSWMRKPEFWAKSLCVILALSLASGENSETLLVRHIAPEVDKIFFFRLVTFLKFHFLCLVVSVICYFGFDRRLPYMYGLSRRGFQFAPYKIPLICVSILVIVAAFSPHFTEYYPLCKPKFVEKLTLISPLTGVWIYETAYAGIFLWTEIVFRGILVLGMGRILGKNAILPMIALYAFIHFPKPMGEALGSVFGGYMLAILAYRTENILGGILLHLVVGMGMEFTAMALTS